MNLDHRISSKTVLDIFGLYENKHLNLEPGFQRQSVWASRDRAKLIDSIIRNYPLPAVFFYKRTEDGHIIYDVIDGKQRIETILMFSGKMRGRFSTKTQLPGTNEEKYFDWNYLKRIKKQDRITSYVLPVIEVDGDISDIIDVFVRINSTGKPLTQQEKRHAKYYQSGFLKEAGRLARRYEQFLMSMGVFGLTQISRMKHVELICELMLSLAQGDVLNKKTALDRVMRSDSMNPKETKRASALLVTTFNRLKCLFPKLRTTRLSQVTDFYTLAVLIGKFEHEGMILIDRKRNQLAWDILVEFSARVDDVRELQKNARGAALDQELYRDYLLTVSQMTDDVNQRRKRESILRSLLESIFAKKDVKRGFTSEQRRIIWNSTANKTCSCGTKLTWDDFTIDHIDPHSKGGKSKLQNAALMCRNCNSSKGNRTKNKRVKK